jgi:hypothetical protein
MRPHLNPIVSAQLNELARLEGRSCAELIKVAIGERFRQYHANSGSTFQVDENGGACGAFMSTRLPTSLRDLVHRFAHDDQRSLSAALKVLVRDGLRARGYNLVAPAPTIADA